MPEKVARNALTDQGFRAEMDLRNEKIGFKIREHTIQRVPYLLVVGDRKLRTNQRGRTYARRAKIWAVCLPWKTFVEHLRKTPPLSRARGRSVIGGLTNSSLTKRVRRNREMMKATVGDGSD